MKINFCFKTDPRLEIASNNITGEGTEAFIKVSMEIEKMELTKEEYSLCQEVYRKLVAKQLDKDFNLIYPITEEEYFENMDDDEPNDDEDLEDIGYGW